MLKAQQKMIFVSYFDGQSKKGNPVKVLNLSDGLRSVAVFMDKDFKLDHDLHEGDEVEVVIEVGIDYRSNFEVRVVEVTPV